MVPLYVSFLYKDSFKVALNAFVKQKLFPRLKELGRLGLLYEHGRIDADTILAMDDEYEIDGQLLTLTLSQRFDLLLCKTVDSMNEYLRGLLPGSGSEPRQSYFDLFDGITFE